MVNVGDLWIEKPY